jgi:hypothetical protein
MNCGGVANNGWLAHLRRNHLLPLPWPILPLGPSLACRFRRESQFSAPRAVFIKKGILAEIRNPFEYCLGAEGGTRTLTGFPATLRTSHRDRRVMGDSEVIICNIALEC